MRPPLKEEEEEEEEEEPPRRRKLVEKDLKRKRRERINDLVSSKRKLKTGGSRGGRGIAIKFSSMEKNGKWNGGWEGKGISKSEWN